MKKDAGHHDDILLTFNNLQSIKYMFLKNGRNGMP